MLNQFLPNFFIIGAPKSGTTALSEYLRLHPNIFFTNPKEPEYFAFDFEGRVITSERDYLRLFQGVDTARHTSIGEGSVCYMFSSVAVREILTIRPDAKFIVMLRNPSDLVISLHAQLLIEGNENLSSFMDAWNAEPMRHAGRKIPVGHRDVKWLYYSDWGKLGFQIKRVLEIVPRERLMVILFDDFANDTRLVYQGVESFLGVPDDGRVEFPKVNERRLPRNIFLQNLIGRGMRFFLPLRTKLTGGRGFGFGAYLTKLNTKTLKREQDHKARRMLIDFYRDDLLLLESLINCDLRHWREGD